MKIRYVFGFLFLFITTLSSLTAFSAYGDENDLDNDGVPNEQDRCPNLQEDYSGEIDGCPDDYISPYDFDSDGLPDAIDACPEAPETYNRYQDEDGCPDTLVESVDAYEFPDVDKMGPVFRSG